MSPLKRDENDDAPSLKVALVFLWFVVWGVLGPICALALILDVL